MTKRNSCNATFLVHVLVLFNTAFTGGGRKSISEHWFPDRKSNKDDEK